MDFWGYKKRTALLGFAGTLIAAVLLLLSISEGWGPVRSLFGLPVKRDLNRIVATDTLRVITRNHPLSYYLYRGTRRGFDFELLQRFAQEQGVVIEVVVPPTWGDMIPWLYQGKGDIIAAQVSITNDRKRLVDFTQPYLKVTQVVVGTDEDPPPMTLDELEGKSILVRRGSSYEERLLQLKRNGLDIQLIYHDEEIEEDDPVQLVARGRFPYTVVDNTLAKLEQHFYPGLEIGLTLTEAQDIAWAVRPNSPDLLEALNDFLRRNERSTFFNILKSRYFDDPDRFLRHRSAQLSMARDGRISRYDRYFQDAAKEAGLDWRLLAAQSYHESRFRPNKVSWAGAVGLMQLMPRTARDMGIRDLYNPRLNILAGARYMRLLYNLYSDSRSEDDRIKMVLGAYNAGIGHVSNAKRLAAEVGGDSTAWNDVGMALAMLEKPEYYQRDGYAFVRGRTVRRYVEDVLERYRIFKDLMPASADTVTVMVEKR